MHGALFCICALAGSDETGTEYYSRKKHNIRVINFIVAMQLQEK